MTELESARTRLAEIEKKAIPVHYGVGDCVKKLARALLDALASVVFEDDVNRADIIWLCDQLSGFLNGETVKRLEAENLEHIKRIETVMQCSIDARDKLWKEAARERDSLREQLAPPTL